MMQLPFEFEEPSYNPEQQCNGIEEYISHLPEPGKSICSDILLQGDKVYKVARKFHISSYKVVKIVRLMMWPVAVELGIAPAAPLLPAGTPGHPPRRAKRYSRTPRTPFATAEVPGRDHRLSFCARQNQEAD